MYPPYFNYPFIQRTRHIFPSVRECELYKIILPMVTLSAILWLLILPVKIIRSLVRSMTRKTIPVRWTVRVVIDEALY